MKLVAARLGAPTLALVAAVTLSGCGSQTYGAATPGAGAAVAADASTDAPTVAPTATPSAMGTAARAADPTAAATPAPVKRNGKPAKTTVPGVSGGLKAKTNYKDGLALQVTDVAHSVNTETGPGVLQGEQLTTFTLTVTNNTAAPVDLSGVVLEAAYGAPKRVASPVYTADSRDLSGSLEPGKSASAGYSFAIPADSRGAVRLTVDLDGVHGLAVLTGSAA